MSQAKVPVGAVIVAYHSTTTLRQCLASLQGNGVQQIVVVNNSPEIPLVDIVGSEVQLVTLPGNVGFAAACNRGAAQVTTPYILFINPDAYVLPGAITTAVAVLQNQPQVGVVGLGLEDMNSVPEADSWGKEVSLLSLIHRHIKTPSHPVGPRECGWVSGGAMVVRRALFQKLQGFDPAFFLYWEDVDFCRRVRRAGWQVVHVPTARVRHERGASLADQQRKTRLYDESADRYFRKHYATTIWLLQRILRRCYRYWVPQVH